MPSIPKAPAEDSNKTTAVYTAVVLFALSILIYRQRAQFIEVIRRSLVNEIIQPVGI